MTGPHRRVRIAALSATVLMAAGLLLTRSHGALAALLTTAVLWRVLVRSRRPATSVVVLVMLGCSLLLVVNRLATGSELVTTCPGRETSNIANS